MFTSTVSPKYGTKFLVTTSEAVARQVRASQVEHLSNDSVNLDQAEILSLSGFQDMLWEAASITQTVATKQQELAVARKFVSTNEETNSVLFSTNLARQLLKAYRAYSEYDIELDVGYFHSVEQKMFINFVGWFNAELGDINMMPSANRINSIIDNIEDAHVLLGGGVEVFITQPLTPAQTRLFDALSDFVEVSITEMVSKPGAAIEAKQYSTVDNEIAGAAKTVAAILSEFKDCPSDAPVIGIASPDLAANQFLIERALETELLPIKEQYLSRSTTSQPWVLNSGLKLSSLGCVRDVIALLRTGLDNIEFNDLSAVLLSRSFTQGTAKAKISLEKRARKLLPLRFSPQQLVTVIEATDTSDEFIRVIKHVATNLQADAKYSPEVWAEHIDKLLEVSGWYEQAHNIHGTWVVRATKEALLSVSRLQAVRQEFTAGELVSWLREILDTQSSNQKTASHIPVKLMGWEEIWDFDGDHLIFMGAEQSALPYEHDSIPFIPVTLLSNAGYPMATPDSCLEHAEKLLTHAQSYETLQLTCSRVDSHGVGLLPIGGFEWKSIELDATKHNASIEISKPDTLPLITQYEAENMGGGVSLLKDHQKASLFAAITHRFKVRKLDIPSMGFNPGFQGSFIHSVLEHFWNDVKTSENLQSLIDNNKALSSKLDECIAITEELPALSLFHFGEGLADLERKRVKNILTECLAAEATRKLPFTVKATEKRTRLNVHGIHLNVVLDRIDDVATEDGNRSVMIDYKTSKNFNMSFLNATNFQEPQLPSYAVYGGKADGICVLQITPEQTKYHLRSDFDNSLIEKKAHKSDIDSPEKWQGELDSWKTQLEVISQEIQQGELNLPNNLKVVQRGYEHLEAFYNIDWAETVTE